MEYTILRNEYAGTLIEVVHQHIADGWEPLGGVALSHGETLGGRRYEVFAQAMTKRVTTVTREKMEPSFAKELRNAMAAISIP